MATRNEYFPQSRPHSGKTLVEKLEEMGLSGQEFAEYIGKSEAIINAVLNGKSAITTDLAVQFENVTKIPAHFWLNSQRNYDEYLANKEYMKTPNIVQYV